MDNNDIPVIGIDLGTRFSCVSIWRNKRFEIIPDQFGNRTIPSVVAFYKSVRLVGHNALSIKDVNPTNTIYDVKRIIGRKSDDPVIEQVKNLISYELVDDQSEHHNILIKLDNSDANLAQKNIYRPEEVCAYILSYIKKTALEYLHLPLDSQIKAVVTVPAYFNDAQRQATLDSAHIAGLEIIKIINEPTAAALTYGLGDKQGNVIVYDFGAGTLDVSLINICDGVFRTLSVGGNSHLGGEDIDYLIMNHLILEFKKTHKIGNLKMSKLSQIKLKNAVENAKKILSSTDKSVICVDDFYDGKRLYFVLDRNTFETICNELFIMCIKPLNDVLESANLDKQSINEVILVGGSSRIPKIQELILEYFNDTNLKKLTCSMNPDEVVSAGASIYGYIMTHNEDPFSENLVLLDIIPLSLGVETLQKQMSSIIPRNTVIPATKIQTFSTDTDNQESVVIKIFEGERKLTKNNFHVGTFELSGFKKAPRGHPIIQIKFHVDINGILQVTAHEKRSGVENTIQITSTWGAKGRLSKNDIDNIIIEAEKNNHIDMLYSTKINLVHKITTVCESVLININDLAYNLTNADKKRTESDVKNNLKWLKDNKIEDLPIDELERRSKRLESIYAPLIALSNKDNEKFKENNTKSNIADVHGDDEINKETTQYEQVQFEPNDYNKEEIKSLKTSMLELCDNIVSIIHNPISNFDIEDVTTLKHYIETVQLWSYTTSATTSIEFIAKINEINKITEEVLSKYKSDSELFKKNDDFTMRDELQLTCLTLNMSLRNNFFSLGANNTDKLSKFINETMLWLVSHQDEEPTIYQNYINQINEICNEMYHNMHKLKTIELIDEEINEDEFIDEPIKEVQKVNENIGSIINALPDKITKRKIHVAKDDDVLIKIDVTKLTQKD